MMISDVAIGTVRRCVAALLATGFAALSPLARAQPVEAPAAAGAPQDPSARCAGTPGGALFNPQVAQRLAEFELKAPILKRGAPASPTEQLFAARCRSVVFIIGPLGASERDGYATGTGSIVSPEGYVLTALHVVQSLREITVGIFPNCEPGAKPNGFAATLVRADPRVDLALLRIQRPPQDLDVMPLGQLDDVRTGSTVLMIGHPQQLLMSMSQGLISAIRPNYPLPRDNGPERRATVIQTDGALNPGNSGGPMLSMQGRLIGVNDFIFGKASNGLNFAVAVNDVRTFLNAQPARQDPPPATRAPEAQDTSCKVKVVKEWREDGATKKLLDLKCSGKADALLIVPEDPSQRAMLLVDRNGDGKADVRYYLNRNMKPEYSEWDDNFDGSYSYRAEHEDGDWEPKSKVRIARK